MSNVILLPPALIYPTPPIPSPLCGGGLGWDHVHYIFSMGGRWWPCRILMNFDKILTKFDQILTIYIQIHKIHVKKQSEM